MIFLWLLVLWILLRLNYAWERRLQARRRLHALVHPLSHYLGLLDHELQNESHNPDPLVSQAVLDHVTEFRSYLIRPDSKDIQILGSPKWVPSLNSILIRLEENLESAIQGSWDEPADNIKKDVRNLIQDMQNQRFLKRLIEKRVGLVEP